MATSSQINKAPASGGKSGKPRSFMSNDFPYIRKASYALALCAVISLILVVGSAYLLSQLQASKNVVQSERNQAREQLQQAELEKREIRDFQPKFINLQKRGFVGAEKRLEWIEQIRAIQENRRLPPLSYEISPQQIFALDPSIQTGDLELRGSRMQLKMALLHELDLLQFLADLKTRAYFAVKDCTIGSTENNSAESLAPRLQAECDLHWLSMTPRATDAAPEGEQQ